MISAAVTLVCNTPLVGIFCYLLFYIYCVFPFLISLNVQSSSNQQHSLHSFFLFAAIYTAEAAHITILNTVKLVFLWTVYCVVLYSLLS